MDKVFGKKNSEKNLGENFLIKKKNSKTTELSYKEACIAKKAQVQTTVIKRKDKFLEKFSMSSTCLVVKLVSRKTRVQIPVDYI